jgi:hypothetical protein
MFGRKTGMLLRHSLEPGRSKSESHAELARTTSAVSPGSTRSCGTHRPLPTFEKLRLALNQRAEQWKADLGDEPKIVRLLRQIVWPLTLLGRDRSGRGWTNGKLRRLPLCQMVWRLCT